MSIAAKICGLKTPEAVATAIEGDAAFVGFVFYAKSPRCLSAEEAGLLGRKVPTSVKKVGLLVDDSDERIAAILKACPLDMLQLHGGETPERVAAIKSRFHIPAMKALKISTAADVDLAKHYQSVAD